MTSPDLVLRATGSRRVALAEKGARRWLQLALAAIWLLDAILQLQSFMFAKGFGQTLGATAAGNPAVIADPITWSARLIEAHPTWTNAAFASVQMFIALGIAWRPTLKAALAASVAWSLGVWWLGEGLGGVLTGTASPASGAPGAVIIYALLAVLLWPVEEEGAFVAARPLGVRSARLAWLVLWGSLAYFAVQSANRTAQGLHGMLSGMAAGEPGWLASLDRDAAGLVAGQGAVTSVVLAVAGRRRGWHLRAALRRSWRRGAGHRRGGGHLGCRRELRHDPGRFRHRSELRPAARAAGDRLLASEHCRKKILNGVIAFLLIELLS